MRTTPQNNQITLHILKINRPLIIEKGKKRRMLMVQNCIFQTFQIVFRLKLLSTSKVV